MGVSEAEACEAEDDDEAEAPCADGAGRSVLCASMGDVAMANGDGDCSGDDVVLIRSCEDRWLP